VLRRIIRPRREEVAGGWRKPHSKELRNLYYSPDIMTVIKTRTGHVPRMRHENTKFGSENLKGRDRLEDLGVDGKNSRRYLTEIE